MVIQLESQEAVLPLRSVAREFGVAPESADGQMLNLIEQALDFVVAVRLGDKLPSELNGGEASWKPNEQDRKIAISRVRHNLVRCVFALMGKSVTISNGGVPGWEEEPENRELLNQAITGATAQIDGTNAAEIVARAALISDELAYVESMRRTLARGISGPREKLLRIKADQVPVSRQETVKQVQALARRGLTEIMSRFDDVDIRLDDILAMLRDTPAAVAWLRRQRDWLFRTNHAWGPVFADWAGAPNHYDDFLWKVVERTYLFLAPRYMSFQEWSVNDIRMRQEPLRATVW
ncbi:MAG: hypothetical protein P4L90_24745 [Rhodopila sp.]|nr:hypothetical protein [Rhodopila sp.]